MKGSRDSGGGRRREGPRPHKHTVTGTPGGKGGAWGRKSPSGFAGPGNPKSGRRLPLPKQTGGPMDTKRGAKGYRRPVGAILLPEDVEEVSLTGSGEERLSPQAHPRYELLDHTADLSIRVTAGTVEGLFEDAGLALFDLLTDLSRVRPAVRYNLSLRAENLDGLLVQWLRELLYRFFGEKTAFCRLEVTHLAQDSLSAVCWGERMDPLRHTFRTEIKAVTYHGLRVTKTEEGWTADVIFDI